MSGIKLEVGKRYVDHDGNIEAIIGRDGSGKYISASGRAFRESGEYYGCVGTQPFRADLIALAPDEASSEPDELATLRARVEASEKYAEGLAGTLLETRKTRDALRAENARLIGAFERVLEHMPVGECVRDAQDMHLRLKAIKAISDVALARTGDAQ